MAFVLGFAVNYPDKTMNAKLKIGTILVGAAALAATKFGRVAGGCWGHSGPPATC